MGNVYRMKQIHHALNPLKQLITSPEEDPMGMAFLSSIRTSFNCISRELFKNNNIKTLDLPLKVSSFLHPVKNYMGLKAAGIYSIPFKCEKTYI
jgi:hypothetical protein